MKKHTNTGNCLICGVFRERLHEDHIIPKWSGGTEDKTNKQLICGNCHEDKTRKEFQTSEYKKLASFHSKKRIISEITRQKLSHAAKKRFENPIERERMSQINLGRKRTPENKENSRKKALIRFSNPKEREKISQKIKLKWEEKEYRQKLSISQKASSLLRNRNKFGQFTS